MDFEDFVNSLSQDTPPKGINPLLLALWHDGKGNWEASHSLIQDISGVEAAHIHAYLHRKEGDTWNAAYWYRYAGKELPDTDLQEEWRSLAMLFLG